MENNSEQKAHQKDKDFQTYLDSFRQILQQVYHEDDDINLMSVKRGISPEALSKILSVSPHTLIIPKEYGGHGGSIKQNLMLLSVASYESLALSLTLGINNALFLQPFIKYGQESAKEGILKRFVNNQSLGGLMITEPNHGSDALNMQTSWVETEKHYHLTGTKHWAGLTGQADFWLLTARKMTPKGGLQRDVDLFVSDNSIYDQHIVVDEYFENLGLYQIPYGRNFIDIKLPKTQKLVSENSGIQMLMDLLHRSRMQFPGMSTGFVKRMLDEAIAHCQSRYVGGKTLTHYDQVQHQLAILQANYTISSALCLTSSQIAGLENDLNPFGLEANIQKTVTSDIMQQSAQLLTQLVGAAAYKLTHIAGRGTCDSRPFQIFEGANDILYAQIGETVIKLMKNAKAFNFHEFIKNHTITQLAADCLKNYLNFGVEPNIKQRKVVELGYIFSRIGAMNQVINMGDKGFRKDMITNAVSILRQDIVNHISNFTIRQEAHVIDEYEMMSNWTELAL